MASLIVLIRRLVPALFFLTTATAGSIATAAGVDDDPPARVGRFSEVRGEVSIYDDTQGRWEPANRNRPLTTGDRIATDDRGSAELQIGSTTLRIDGGSEVEVLRLDDERVRLQLHDGSLAVRIRSRELADEFELVTDEVRLRPLRAGHYRFDRSDDSTWASSLRGELRVEDDGEAFTVGTGRRYEFWNEDRRLQRRSARWPDDEFGAWLAREDRKETRAEAERYVSPEMTGADDLDRNGRWEQHPEFGAVWIPVAVAPGWAPYRYGHWAWIRPWGWTWVDDAPWGFAPFHYGRWVDWGGRWAWSPGGYVARPVYAPALVAWVGGPNFGISINLGGPAVGWVPLAPREAFVPYYRATPRYRERVNIIPGQRMRDVPSGGTTVYGNQRGALTVVAREVLERRQPVQRGVVELREPMRSLPSGQPELPVLRMVPRPETILPVPYERRRPDAQPGRRDRSDGADGPRERFSPPLPAQPQGQPQPQPQQRDRDERQPQSPRDRGGERGSDRSQRPDAPVPMAPAPMRQSPSPDAPAQPALQQRPASPEPVLRQRPGERDDDREAGRDDKRDEKRKRNPEQRPRERAQSQ